MYIQTVIFLFFKSINNDVQVDEKKVTAARERQMKVLRHLKQVNCTD